MSSSETAVEENRNELPIQGKEAEMPVQVKGAELPVQGKGEELVEDFQEMCLAPAPMKKHPLENAWTLWFFKNDKARTWEENQRPIITVTTVEDFWALYNHIEVASRLPPGSDYSLFKVMWMLLSC